MYAALRYVLRCVFVVILAILPFCTYAQENEQVYIQGRRYLDLNIHSLDKYAKRLERTQHRLLSKLKRKEQRLAKKLLHTDSAAYAKLRANPLTYDSISKLSLHPDSATLAAKALKGGQKAVDSLKGVYAFVQSKAGKLNNINGTINGQGLGDATGLGKYGNELNGLQGRLSYDQYISGLIDTRSTNLNSIAGSNSSVTGMQKELYYAKAKIGEWKKIADEPSKIEDLAFEYLQGTKGFDLSVDKAVNGVGGSSGSTGMNGAANADQLEALGFQTKRQVNAALQQKFGNNLSAVQGNAGQQLNKWQGDAQGLQSNLKETRQSLNGLRHTEQPKFKVNPMRCLPFWKRISKEYGFNAARSTLTPDGTQRPAILTLSAGVAYRQTPKLSAGIGLAGDLGLGQSWSNIRFTFEGIGAKAFLTWQWQYGIGLYSGYERTWKQYAFTAKTDEANSLTDATSVHNRSNYSESVMLGLTKSYKINAKWNGAVQLLYDVWWQDKGLRSPIVLRFVNFN